MTKDHETKKLLETLKKNLDFKNERRLFSRYFGSFLWFVTDSPNNVPENFRNIQVRACGHYKLSEREKSACILCLKNVMKRAESSKTLEKFSCPAKLFGFCYPIAQGDRVYGHVVVCQIKKDPSGDTLGMFAAFTDTVVKQVQKELELQKLYETIRPRAIALSTVHTLHRLISSTLNLNELLSRIARLSLQVIRASRCSIKLVDSKRKVLLPKTTIDLRRKKAKLKKIRIGRWAPGKAVKYTKAVRGRDYLATPLIDEDVIGVITLYDKIDRSKFTDFDEEIMRTFCEQAVIAIKNAQLFKEQEKLTIGAIKSIAAILAAKASGTLIPKESFLKIVNLVGQEMRLSELELKSLEYASLLHDAGEIALPDKVIRKKGILTGKEYNLIKEHPSKAALILKPLKPLKSVVQIILHHHENYDGTGYPSGLKGSNIPMGARIMGVVAAFEAMIAEKPYRKKLSIKAAIAEVKRNSGRQFDPEVVSAFLDVLKRKAVMDTLRREKNVGKKTHK